MGTVSNFYHFLRNHIHLIVFFRLFWAVIIAGGIAITLDTIIENWNDLNKDPLYIMTEDFSLELTNVAFPGVAICNINKISKKRVTELARSLQVFYFNSFSS